MIPEPFEFLLLALVAYRLWRLLAEDEVLKWPRHWLVRLPRNWEEGDPLPRAYREKLALFIMCPWCAGAWISLLMYVVYLATLGKWPESTSDVVVGLGMWLAISASVGLIRSTLDPPEEG